MIYSENQEIIVKTDEVVVVKFGKTRIPIYKNDEIFVLSDPFVDGAEGKPSIYNMTFDEFCESIYGDDFEEYEFDDDLMYMYGISVVHH